MENLSTKQTRSSAEIEETTEKISGLLNSSVDYSKGKAILSMKKKSKPSPTEFLTAVENAEFHLK